MQHVVIFGATSAIAAEAAKIFALRGDRVHLVGRTPQKLTALAERVSAGLAAGQITTQVADFSELSANEEVVQSSIAELGRVDVALIAHGDLGDQLASERSFEAAEPILQVNFTSVISLLIPLANHMEAAGTGRIGVITSVAGERGRPRNYTYGAAKGALHVYLQGLRSRLYRSGVSVTTLKLGPVDTPMTRDHTKNVLFAKPERVAQSIVRALDASPAEAFVPSFWWLILLVVRNLPEALFQKLSFLSGR